MSQLRRLQKAFLREGVLTIPNLNVEYYVVIAKYLSGMLS